MAANGIYKIRVINEGDENCFIGTKGDELPLKVQASYAVKFRLAFEFSNTTQVFSIFSMVTKNYIQPNKPKNGIVVENNKKKSYMLIPFQIEGKINCFKIRLAEEAQFFTFTTDDNGLLTLSNDEGQAAIFKFIDQDQA